MNYLAHACLSFGQPGILLGNMASDFVKGRKQYEFPRGIQKGIQLHRAIDAFTDIHPATQELKKFFKPHYRLYSGAFADIVFDYFLANDEKEFINSDALNLFCYHTYISLRSNMDFFPPGFRVIFPYMVEQNWLYNYQYDSGIEKSFAGMVMRARYMHDSHMAYEIFIKNKLEMQYCYKNFYPSVKKFAMLTLHRLTAE